VAKAVSAEIAQLEIEAEKLNSEIMSEIMALFRSEEAPIS
jgi:hypothetical protein